MVEFSWIYIIIFLAIPLSRIIPRLLAKRKMATETTKNQDQLQQNYFQKSNTQNRDSKPKTKNMLVLGEINQGSKTFEKIQKNTGFENKELDTILQELEKNELIKVHQKQGLFGPKIELYLTEKGFKEYT